MPFDFIPNFYFWNFDKIIPFLQVEFRYLKVYSLVLIIDCLLFVDLFLCLWEYLWVMNFDWLNWIFPDQHLRICQSAVIIYEWINKSCHLDLLLLLHSLQFWIFSSQVPLQVHSFKETALISIFTSPLFFSLIPEEYFPAEYIDLSLKIANYEVLWLDFCFAIIYFRAD